MNELQMTKMVQMIRPAVVDDDTATGIELDTYGWRWLRVDVMIGATDIAMTALKLTESDTAGSGHADITGCIYGTSANDTGSTSALPTSTDDGYIFSFELSLVGRKRYINIVATAGNGTTGVAMAALATLGKGEQMPRTASSAGLHQRLSV
jgi:hypothetical protein